MDHNEREEGYYWIRLCYPKATPPRKSTEWVVGEWAHASWWIVGSEEGLSESEPGPGWAEGQMVDTVGAKISAPEEEVR